MRILFFKYCSLMTAGHSPRRDAFDAVAVVDVVPVVPLLA